MAAPTTASQRLDWRSVSDAARECCLLPFLERNVARHHWAFAKDTCDWSLLHMAACHGDATAVVALLHEGSDVRAVNTYGDTPAHCAALHGQARTLKLLLAGGADVHAKDEDGNSVVDAALREQHIACVYVLLDHGVRLEALLSQRRITPAMRVYQVGVCNCRCVVLSLLGIKHRRSPVLDNFDKFLVKLLARGIWMTRGQKEWQTA